jgi:hypothetical protein
LILAAGLLLVVTAALPAGEAWLGAWEAAGRSATPPPSAADERLEIGAAQVDITPAHSVIMGGYGIYFGSARNCRWSQGARDPLLVGALYLQKGRGHLLVLTLDLVGLSRPDILDIRERIAAALPIERDRIILSVSHTHHSPDTMGLWGTVFPPRSGLDEGYLEWLKQQSVAAATRAYHLRRPASLGLVVGEEAELHWNERQVDDPNAPIDHTLTVLVAKDEGGQILASLTNWACHPTTEDERNLRLSADWVGDYRQFLGGKFSGVHIFVNGAIGGSIQPSVPWRKQNLRGDGQGFAWAHELGERLGAKAAGLIAQAQPVDVPAIEVRRAPVRARLTNRTFELVKALGILKTSLPKRGEWYYTEVTAAKLGRLRVGTLPGEVMPNLTAPIRRSLGGDAQLLIGLAQDELGYIVDQKYYDDPRYGYEKFLCVNPQLGPNLVRTYEVLRFD